MPSLWTELLHLHGHLCDWRPAGRQAEAPPRADPPPDPHAPTMLLRAAWRQPLLRLCLGIGDGEMHRQ